MGLEFLALAMLVAFVVVMLIGVPAAYAAAATGIVFGFIGFGDGRFHLLLACIYCEATDHSLFALPMFVFTVGMLEKSRLGQDMRAVMSHIAGHVPGGMGIIVFGVILGATTGIVGSTIVMLNTIVLPTLPTPVKYKTTTRLPPAPSAPASRPSRSFRRVSCCCWPRS